MLVLLISTLMASPIALANKDVPAIFVHTRVAREPVDRPIEVTLKIRCNKKKTVEFHKEKYCEFVSLDKDMPAEKVMLNVLNYNPDTGFCEKSESIEISFKGSCNP